MERTIACSSRISLQTVQFQMLKQWSRYAMVINDNAFYPDTSFLSVLGSYHYVMDGEISCCYFLVRIYLCLNIFKTVQLLKLVYAAR